MNDDLVKGFWKRVVVRGEDECWEWIGYRLPRGGHGTYNRGKKYHYAHRLAYEIATGKKPQLFVLHRCDNPVCVNPKHLYEGTQADNVRDREERGRSGDRSGENNNHSKMTWSGVNDVRSALARGDAVATLAAKYGVGLTAIRDIGACRSWNR